MTQNQIIFIFFFFSFFFVVGYRLTITYLSAKEKKGRGNKKTPKISKNGQFIERTIVGGGETVSRMERLFFE